MKKKIDKREISFKDKHSRGSDWEIVFFFNDFNELGIYNSYTNQHMFLGLKQAKRFLKWLEKLV